MVGIVLALVATTFLVAAGRLLSTRLVPDAAPAERWTAACVCAYAGLVVATQHLSLVGGISRTGFLITAVLLLAAAYALRRPECEQPPAGNPSSILSRLLLTFSLFAVSLTCIGALWRGLYSPVLVDTDGPIYHLPFAVRWLQEGSLTRVWTPFGELAATYFPGNGEIWLCWLLALVGDDRLAKVGQWFFLLPTGAALVALGRSAGGDRLSSVWPALCFLACPFVAHYSMRPNVDFPMTFLLLSGAAFLTRAATARDPDSRRGPLILAALALGAAAGTKSVALLFAFIPFLAVLWLARGSAKTLLQLSAAALAGGGYWFLRNALETGNPLYPYRLSFAGRVFFDGWYDAAVMRATSEYHIPVGDDTRARTILSLVLPPVPPTWRLPLFAAFSAGLFVALARRRDGRRALVASVALAILWAAEYWFVQPYNTQPRFLLPALALAFVPLAALRGAWHVVPAALLLGTLLESLRSVSHWDWRFFVAGLVVLAAAASVAMFRPRVQPAALVGGSTLGLLLSPTLFAPRSSAPPPFFYSTRDFGERLFPAWLRLQTAIDADGGGQGAVVGYAGTNLPYFLAGPTQTTRVRYVNVQGEASWLPHDHFRRRRAEGTLPSAETAFPQWHRDQPNKEAWLRNLDALGVGYFFIARENFHGRPDAPTGTPPFPIEYDWIVSTPDRFERLGPPAQSDGVEPWGMSFRVRPKAQTRTN